MTSYAPDGAENNTDLHESVQAALGVVDVAGDGGGADPLREQPRVPDQRHLVLETEMKKLKDQSLQSL